MANQSKHPRPNLTAAEIAMVRKLYHEKDMSPKDIAHIYDRDRSTITRILFIRKKPKKAGRKPCLSKEQVDNLVKRLDEMVASTAGKQHPEEITVAKLKRRTKCKASEKTILRALHKRGIYFHPLRQKPVLTEEDVKARLKFSKLYNEGEAGNLRSQGPITGCIADATQLRGQLLLALSEEGLVQEVGLSRLQAKKAVQRLK